MKRLLMLCLLLASPVFAATNYTCNDPTSGCNAALVTTNDTLTLSILGTKWATVKFHADTAGTTTITAQYYKDSGLIVNARPSAYCTRLSTASSNPLVQAISSTTLTTGDWWECPLAGDTTQFQLLAAAGGTATTISVAGGVPYAPGVPVYAVLWDVTPPSGSSNNTGTLEGSGWSALSWDIVVTGASTGTAAVQEVDDAGSAITIATLPGLGVGTFAGGLGTGVSMGTGITPITGLTQVPLPRRFGFALAGAASSVIRLRVVVRR